MRLNIANKSVFHKIGQGQFFTGSFTSQNTYNYVIDCGSESETKLNYEIDRYKEELSDDSIDLFVISHFHEDHFCGIQKFKDIEIKKLVLPYLDKIQRIYLCARILLKPKKKTKVEYTEFIFDPISYLKREGFNVKEIIYVKSNDDGYEKRRGDDNTKDDNYDDLNKSNDEVKLYDIISRGNIKDTYMAKNKKDISYNVYENLAITILNLIEFDFYNNIEIDGNLDKFRDSSVEGINIEEYFKSKSIKDIIKGMSKKSTKNEIKLAYKKVDKTINNAALCVSITPVGNCSVNSVSMNRDYRYDVYNEIDIGYREVAITTMASRKGDHHRFLATNSRNGYIKNFGYMFTGDISLNVEKTIIVLDYFINHYENKKEKIQIFVVPHHGSKYNWTEKIIQNFKESIFIVCAGINNKYGHPHILVCNSIDIAGSPWIWINEYIDSVVYYNLEFNFKTVF